MDQDFHLIEKYFQGELSQEELQLFNQKLQEDSAFEQEFRDMKLIRDAVKETSRIRALDILQQAEANLTNQETTKINVSMKRLVSIAASLLIVATVSYFAFSGGTGALTGEEIVATYYEPYTNIVSGIERDGDRPIELTTLKARAYNAYDIGDFSISSDLFSDLLVSEKDAANYLYSGIANLESGNLNVAKANLSTVIKEYSTLKSQAQWYLSMALFKEEITDEGVALLANLALGESDYNDKARKVLDDLGLDLAIDTESGQSEDIKLIPPTGSVPDGPNAKHMGLRQYQVGFVKSLKSNIRHRFINEEPMYELQDGDLVEFVLIEGGSDKTTLAVIIGSYQ